MFDPTTTTTTTAITTANAPLQIGLEKLPGFVARLREKIEKIFEIFFTFS